MKLSLLADNLIPSEIVKIGSQIRDMLANGEKLYNFTVGDFDPSIFPIPKKLEDAICDAYRIHQTNYPAPEGNADLRESIRQYHLQRQQLSYGLDEILVATGGRPLIYTIFQILCDAGDRIIYPVPSWNNNHYVQFVNGESVIIPTTAEDNFMPTAERLAPHLKGASLLCLCSPQNPTGTLFEKEQLEAICDLVLEENKQRGEQEKKLYVMYDQMYWQLTYEGMKHYDPVGLRPAMHAYTIYVDAISKVFASTGVRVGWSLGPAPVIQKMKALLSHSGGWAPMAEQKAVARYLADTQDIDNFLSLFRTALQERLIRLHLGIQRMKAKGLRVDSIAPQAAIYLTLCINASGMHTKEGSRLNSQTDVTAYILHRARLALVPFYAFGDDAASPWYRLSVGTCRLEEIDDMLALLEEALLELQQ